MANETKPKDDAVDAELSEEQLDGVSGGLATFKVLSPNRAIGTGPEPHLEPTPNDGSPVPEDGLFAQPVPEDG